MKKTQFNFGVRKVVGENKAIAVFMQALGRVVQMSVNVNPGLNANCSFVFSCLKMFFTVNLWCSLRLLCLKTAGQAI